MPTHSPSPVSADSIISSPPIEACFSELDHTARMMAAHWVTQSVFVAAKLELPERLAGRPRTAAQLADETETNADALGRVLRALVSLGVFARSEDGFQLTEISQRLLGAAEDSLRDEALQAGEHMSFSWGDLLYSVQTGQPSFNEKFGMPIFEYLAENPMVGAMFDSAMSGFHGRDIANLLDAYDLSERRVLADIGGGNASLLVSALKRHPHLRGILYDLPKVVERASQNLANSRMTDRCQTVAGDFNVSELPEADCLLLRHVLHNWSDEGAVKILAKCRASLPPDGRVVIAENVIPESDEPHFGKLLDLAMLVIPGGRERTEAEFAKLFDDAGLRLNRVARTSGEMCAVEAVPR